MSGRVVFLVALLVASLGLAGVVLVAAMLKDALNQQVLFAVLPLVILATIAWNGLGKPRD